MPLVEKCPECKGEDIAVVGEPQLDEYDEIIEIAHACNECSHEWTQRYKITPIK